MDTVDTETSGAFCRIAMEERHWTPGRLARHLDITEREAPHPTP